MKYYTNVSVDRGKIYHKYYTENGRHIETVKFKPHLFHSMSKQAIGKTQAKYYTIKGKPVQRLDFETIPDAREHLQRYRHDGLVHGNTDFQTMFIHENYPEETTDFDFKQIRIWFWDIEVDSSDGFPDPKKALSEILTITIYDTKDRKYHILYTTDSKPNEKPDREFHRYPNEAEMMRALLRMFQIYNPDVLSGWNSETFDNIYVVNRLKMLFGKAGANDLSPYHSVRTREITGTYGKVDQIAYIDGIECIDYLDLYRKFNFTPRESYRLGFISQEELGKTKLEYRGSLDDFLKTDPDNFLEYNIKDVELLKELDEKLKFFELCFSVAYMTKVNYSDVLGTVKPWSSKLYYELEKEGIIIDYYTAPESQPTYEAAYVKEPIPGRYKSIVTIDATSMYPHMIMGFNVSPEKKVEYRDCPDELKPYFLKRNVEKVENGQFHIEPLLKKYGMCICGNGQMYRVDSEGIIPKIVKSVFNQRKVAKKEMLETEKLIEAGNEDPTLKVKAQNLNTNQMALKILMNSLYGALGNKHFPLFDLQSAEGITLSAQAGIRYVNKEISKWLSKITGKDKDYVVYTDTDSSHIIMDDILEKFGISPSDIDTLQEITDNKIQSVVSKITDEYAHMMNMLWSALIFKREKICGCFTFPDGHIGESAGFYVRKKRYGICSSDIEGVRLHEPHLAVTGLETQRSSTPKVIRNGLMEAFEIITHYNEEKLQKFVKEFHKKFLTLKPEEIAFPTSANNIEKFLKEDGTYKKGSEGATPIGVRSAILYNKYIKEKNLENIYTPIQSGEKLKMLVLNEKNPTGENVIGFKDILPPEFGLEKYVDYETNYVKGFLEPLKSVCEAVGWSPVKKYTLDSFFG